MHPIIFSWGHLHIYSYGLMVALGIIAAMFFIEKDAVKHGIAKDKIIDLMFWSIVWGIIGARVFYILLYPETFADDPLSVFKIYEGGLVFHGGLIFGTIAAFVNLKKKNLPVLRTLDILTVYMPLAHAFGRIGCFLNGCCYGKPYQGPWAVKFSEYSPAVHPTQLYSAFLLLLIFVFLKSCSSKKSFSGRISALYLILYGLMRFSIEFLRDNPVIAFNLSAYQFISTGLVIAGVILYIRQNKKTAGSE
jgi:phosphatidylglycerol:prolipoprotein diacylglycerol transferase